MNAPLKKPAKGEKIVMIAVDLLDDSPTNPRQHYDGIEDLARTVATNGIIQPLVVRPVGDRFEIGAGHRRKRAAIVANLAAVPCVVRELTDQQIVEMQLVENVQRRDIEPLDEGRSYQRLIELGLSADDICDRVGKSRSWVYGRIKLCDLSLPAQTALAEGRISASVALAIARRPSDTQEAALAAVLVEQGEDPLSFREAKRRLEWHGVRLRLLRDAPFDVATEISGTAPACTACPKATTDDHGADVCTDPLCWRAKVDHELARQGAELEKSGVKVLPLGEAAKVVKPGHSSPRAGWLRLNDDLLRRVDVEFVTYAPISTTTESRYAPFARATAVEASLKAGKRTKELHDLRARGLLPCPPKRAAAKAANAQNQEREQEREREYQAHLAQVRPVVEAIEGAKKPGDVPAWIYYLLAEVAEHAGGTSEELERRRGWNEDWLLEEKLEGMEPIEAFALAVDLALTDRYGGPGRLKRAMEAAAKADAAAKKAATKKAAAKKSAAKGGRS